MAVLYILTTINYNNNHDNNIMILSALLEQAAPIPTALKDERVNEKDDTIYISHKVPALANVTHILDMAV